MKRLTNLRLACACLTVFATCGWLVGCGEIVIPAGADATTSVDSSTPPQDTTSPDSAITCTFGVDATCDDHDSCTQDLCSATGECLHTPLTNVCKIDGACYADGAASPGNACQVCAVAKLKTQWSVKECNDDNPCTDDKCEASGCVPAALDSGACDDGLECTTDDHCAAGACVATPCGCASDAQCEGRVNVVACQKANCVDLACVAVTDPAQDGKSCDDANGCTTDDACKAGACTGQALACAALAGPCASVTCHDGTCDVIVTASGSSCVPNSSCVTGATCSPGGNCVGTWDAAGACACTLDADCDDGEFCTQDLCNKGTHACTNGVVVGACRVLDGCFFAGQPHPVDLCLECNPSVSQDSWAPVSCSDSDDCTVDSCDPATGCAHTPDPTCCHDSSDCALIAVGACEIATCLDNTCEVFPNAAANGKTCQDGDVCTLGDTCLDGKCASGSAKSCPSTECNLPVCDPVTGVCSTTFATPGATCTDGDPCTLDDGCSATGTCTGTAKDCSALADACHSATCDSATGGCPQAVLVGSACDDGDGCTTSDVCAADGSCSGSFDATVPGCGCAVPSDCTVMLPECSTVDCIATKCVTTVMPGQCAVGGVCYSGAQSLAGNACLVCDPGISQKQLVARSCDDASPCTDDTCAAATGCVNTPNDSNSCDDGDACTGDDHCAGGKCAGTCECRVDADCIGAAPTCQKRLCIDYTCDDVADAGQNGAACEDGAFCTVGETCADGFCGGGGPRDCLGMSVGQCTVGQCDEAAKVCKGVPAPGSPSCDDADKCTDGDHCQGTTCAGTPKSCKSLSDQCNQGACVGGACQAIPIVGQGCSDGVACTTNDVCDSKGGCAGSWDQTLPGCGCASDSACTGLSDPCNTGRCNLGAHTCFKEPKVGAVCDDGNACTQTDVCSAGGTCGGSSYVCTAPLGCQTPACNGLGGCTVTTLPGFCVIDNKCYSDGQTNAGNFCQQCSAGKSQTNWSAKIDSTPCDKDGSGCTIDDSCLSGACVVGPAVVCPDDNKTCTDQVCQSVTSTTYTCTYVANSTGCLVGTSCFAPGQKNPNNTCQLCLPSTSNMSWANEPNNTPCNFDDDGCSVGDACTGGQCLAGTVQTCSDSLACTTDKCVSSSATSYTCQNAIVGGCVINGVCYAPNAANPINECQICDATASKTSWTNKSAGASCGAGATACSGQDTCSVSGVCQANDKTLGAACGDTGTSCTNQDTCNGTGMCIDNGFKSSGTTCGSAATDCSNQDTCNAAGLCQANDKSAGANCGDTGTQCTNQDSCNGSGSCVDNGVKPTGVTCGSGPGECSNQDTCNSAGVCQTNDKSAGTTCGDTGTQCINQDTCNSSGACTDNGFKTSGTTCGLGSTECSGQDTCNGGGICQPNDKPVGTNCGDTGTQCTNQDTCNAFGACSDNGFKLTGTTCGAGPVPCSGQDTCNGAGACAVNDKLAGASCGDTGTTCINQDLCDGGGTCVDKGRQAAGTLCGAGATPCSDPDTCTASGACAANDKLVGTNCGDTDSECVNQDNCSGSGACIDNGFKTTGTLCGAAPTVCSGQDTCNGGGTCQKNDLGQGATCGDAARDCVNQDRCSGSGTCVDSGFWGTGLPCGQGPTECSGQDTCDAGGNCQTNHLGAGALCGSPGTTCTHQDTCDGGGLCNDNGVEPDGTLCDTVLCYHSMGCVDYYACQGGNCLFWYNWYSCPMLYTWNGQDFGFESDLYPSGYLGLKLGNGYRKPDPNDAYVLSQPLVEHNGTLGLRIVEELDEIDYIDQARLYSVDVPSDREVVAVANNVPLGNVPLSSRLMTIAKTRQPLVSAVHTKDNADVSAELAASDRNYLVVSEDLNQPYWNSIVVDLGDLSNATTIKLIVDGRSRFPNTAAGKLWQQTTNPSGQQTKLEVLDASGNWVEIPRSQVTLVKPKEYRRPMGIDITGIFKTTVYKVRLSWFYKTYLDTIWVDTTPAADMVVTEAPLLSGSLNHHGFSAKTPDTEIPDYFYSQPGPQGPSLPSGAYTRYGDISPLLGLTDDMFAVFGAGDEVSLEFSPVAPPPIGTARHFVMFTAGYYKENITNPEVPFTVGPLPFYAMTNFPYNPATESYPTDAAHQEYLNAYNTRLVPSP